MAAAAGTAATGRGTAAGTAGSATGRTPCPSPRSPFPKPLPAPALYPAGEDLGRNDITGGMMMMLS